MAHKTKIMIPFRKPAKESRSITFEKKVNNCTFPGGKRGGKVRTLLRLLQKQALLISWWLPGLLSACLTWIAGDHLPDVLAKIRTVNQRKDADRQAVAIHTSFRLPEQRMMHDPGNYYRLAFQPGSSGRPGLKTEPTVITTYVWGIALGASAVIPLLLILLIHGKRRQRKQEAQISALRAAQMNPHFVSNTLNAIENLIHQRKNRDAAKYLVFFSRFSHQVLQRSRRPNISLQEEVQILGHFLELEKLRFHNKLNYEIKLSGDLQPDLIEVPALFLQAYVEDAIWDGIKPKAGASHLKIALNKEGRYLLAHIEDDGIGREASRALKSRSQQEQRSLGLEISEERVLVRTKIRNARIETIDLFNASGEPAGTRVQLLLPIKLLQG